ncbi:hypothetical protein EVAR_89950_1 [Eumeta japonica]|uniref:Uncharacterized protein n=1 Tax=Eumeta variegata TaxID=151549 RepID=A0A4C2AC91_EUMVA|nr:hypothetical protein EVAR_89950_1 [Eumeta japonica]
MGCSAAVCPVCRLWAWPARFDVTVTSPRQATLSAETPCSAATRQLAIDSAVFLTWQTGRIGGFTPRQSLCRARDNYIRRHADGLRDGQAPRESPGEAWRRSPV